MDDFDLMIRDIMISRKPEHWLDNIFMNLTKYTSKNYPDTIFYKIGNDLVFDYDIKNESFYYNYLRIYLILKEKYHCDENKINVLIVNNVEKYLKLNVKKIQYLSLVSPKVEQNLKLSENLQEQTLTYK